MVILICDDNKSFAQQLQECIHSEIQKKGWQAEIIVCQHENEVFDKVRQGDVDVVFLDIGMEQLSGFDIAEVLSSDKEAPYIIFVSNLEHLVYDSFVYHPFWFLRKRDIDQISLILSRLEEELRFKKKIYSFEINGQMIQLELKNIIYIESDNHHINIYTKDHIYRQKTKISDVANKLEPYYFIRTHIGYLVNSIYIKQIRKQDILLVTGDLIPISRSQIQNVKKSFMTYVRNRQV